jgi:hypothetical protein
MKKLKVAAGVLVGFIVVLVGVGFALPSTWKVQRTLSVSAAPAEIYPLIANFKDGWPRWNPFGPRMDPEVQMTYSGPESGVGATQTFVGGQLGSGTMKIVEASPETGVVYVLEGGAVRIKGTIALAANATGTLITWTDEGDMGGNPLMHYAAMMAGKMSGAPMEQGLRDLQTSAEPRAPGTK